MEHVLHIVAVPALDKTAGVLRIVLHGDDVAPLDHDRDVFLPAVAEFGGLCSVVAVLERGLFRLAAACGQQCQKCQ